MQSSPSGFLKHFPQQSSHFLALSEKRSVCSALEGIPGAVLCGWDVGFWELGAKEGAVPAGQADILWDRDCFLSIGHAVKPKDG